MDPFEEFLSPEALRLLLDSDDFATTADQPLVFTSDQSLSLTTPPTSAVDILSPEDIKPIRKRSASSANIPGCSTLVLDKTGSAKPKRAKFSAEGRAKVASVRKKGACMRCNRNKIPCSGEWPCESCCRSRAIIAGRASRHRWMGCVPFSMKDLDIFACKFVQKDRMIDELHDRSFEFTRVDFLDIWLGEAEFHLTMESGPSLGSRTFGHLPISRGPPSQRILRSKEPLSNHVDSRLDKSFQILATTWLIEYFITEGTLHVHNDTGLRYARSLAGSKLLECLEKTLGNSSLSKLGADTLGALMRILLFTVSVVTWSRLHWSLELDDRQQQLVRVLAHHACYIGDRLHCFESIDKEVFVRNIACRGRIASYEFPASRVKSTTPLHVSRPKTRKSSSHIIDGHFSRPKGYSRAAIFANQCCSFVIKTSHGLTEPRDQPLEETSQVIPPALVQRKGEISQPTLYNEADIVSEPKNDGGSVQRHATARSPCLADPQPEDGYWAFGEYNEIDPAISTGNAIFPPELQPDTVCSWCGCLQNSYKPSQGLISCDNCLAPYQQNDLAAAGWGLGEYRSTEPLFNPPSGLNSLQGEWVNHALRPEVTTLGSHGNDLDDFSWFMAS